MNNKVTRTIMLGNGYLTYELTYKNVKNINLRIKPDGTVHVSANPYVSPEVIERFVASKEEFILNALKKYSDKTYEKPVQRFKDNELYDVITDTCRKVYPHFEKCGVKFPEIKLRKMKSCWGNCRALKGVLTFSTNLVYAPIECIEYVVLHEFTHFLQANHSPRFYAELEKVCPDWKEKKKLLMKIRI
ncbi:MAG: M48 family metallopeptidase [Ruminococcaceae bacterium]|nr:M48 family metallopeptidase [Oscillospiraceae bacterium]